MTETICLSKTQLLLIFSILIIFLLTYIHYNQYNLFTKQANLNQANPNQANLNQANPNQANLNQANLNQANPNQELNNYLEKKRFLNTRDIGVRFDDFAPPERRVAENIYPIKYVKQQINFPTRGFPDNYQLIGLVSRPNTETFYNLFGRQTFPNSNQYEYYIQARIHGNEVKIPVNTQGDKEIVDGQHIRVPNMDASQGPFKVKLYNYDIPRYNPYI